jgi:hypothetical protein
VSRAALAVAYERLRVELLKSADHAELKANSRVRRIMLRVLDKLRADLDRFDTSLNDPHSHS